MNEFPVVLVHSIGKITSDEIIKNIRKETDPKQEVVDSGFGSHQYHKHSIKTKYYETTVALLSFQGSDINELPPELLKNVEMIVMFFDSSDKSILQRIPSLNTFVEMHDIEIGLMLTDKLSNESAAGPTYSDIKSKCLNTFDLIELCTSETENECDASSGELSYDDVHQALNNHVWTNVQFPHKAVGQDGSKSLNGSDSDTCMEEQLDTFENLLMYVQNFKRVSRNMQRDEMLDEAEKIAQLFDTMLIEK